MQILVVYLSFKVVLYWSCNGVVILYFNAFACICLLCVWGGCAEPLAWLCPDEGGAEVRPEAWGGWVVRSFRPGSVPTKEGQRSGLKRGLCGWLGGLEFLAGWLVRDGKSDGRGQPAKSPTRCVGLPKIPKIPKIPIALDDTGELKQLP